ncbi:MAG: hypothetical protein Q9167_003517 [Letrouitia subvulpina]
MATQSLINFDAQVDLQFRVSTITPNAASKASELLQENHDKHHIMFNNSGLHNHIVHHICTSLALGAAPDVLEQNYSANNTYQRSPPPLHGELVKDLHDPKVFIRNMYRPEAYSDFLKFFTLEIQSKGYKKVVNEYVFADDERASTMFNRLFAGFLHPVIHLGFGVEFEQPAIIAEALAQTAIHSTWLDQFFIESERAARASHIQSDSLMNIVDKIQKDYTLSCAAHWDDDNKIRDGILARAKEEMINYACQWQVQADRTEESWIDTASKVKLLTWKGRYDLLLYASRRSPPLLLNEITSYSPKHKESNWDAIFSRARIFNDDGHTCKMIRALAHGERASAPYEISDSNLKIQGRMWLQLANMGEGYIQIVYRDCVTDFMYTSVMDSRETGAKWVRSAGFDEAWEE